MKLYKEPMTARKTEITSFYKDHWNGHIGTEREGQEGVIGAFSIGNRTPLYR